MVLLMLHIYWAFLILRMFYKLLFSKVCACFFVCIHVIVKGRFKLQGFPFICLYSQLEGDERSDEEEDDTDSQKEQKPKLSHVNGSGIRGRANGHWHVQMIETEKRANGQQSGQIPKLKLFNCNLMWKEINIPLQWILFSKELWRINITVFFLNGIHSIAYCHAEHYFVIFFWLKMCFAGSLLMRKNKITTFKRQLLCVVGYLKQNSALWGGLFLFMLHMAHIFASVANLKDRSNVTYKRWKRCTNWANVMLSKSSSWCSSTHLQGSFRADYKHFKGPLCKI